MIDQKPDDVVFIFSSFLFLIIKVIIRGRAPDACTCSRELWRNQLVRDEGVFKAVLLFFTFRVASCVQVFPAQGKVTSLDLSPDHCQLLSCCRDDCLQLFDLRRWSNERLTFRYVRTR